MADFSDMAVIFVMSWEVSQCIQLLLREHQNLAAVLEENQVLLVCLYKSKSRCQICELFKSGRCFDLKSKNSGEGTAAMS